MESYLHSKKKFIKLSGWDIAIQLLLLLLLLLLLRKDPCVMVLAHVFVLAHAMELAGVMVLAHFMVLCHHRVGHIA